MQMNSPESRNLEIVLLFLVCVGLQTHGDCGTLVSARQRHPAAMAVSIQISAIRCVAGCATGINMTASGLVHGVTYRLLLVVQAGGTEIHSDETSITWIGAQGSEHLVHRMLPPLPEGTFTMRVTVLDAAASTEDEVLLASVSQRLVSQQNPAAHCLERFGQEFGREQRENDEKASNPFALTAWRQRQRESALTAWRQRQRENEEERYGQDAPNNLVFDVIFGSSNFTYNFNDMVYTRPHSQVWIDKGQGLVLKRINEYFQTFDREVYWLQYFEDAGEDVAPRLIASFSGDNKELEDEGSAPMLLMENAGERLEPSNAPGDWERQIADILEVLRAHNCSHNDLKDAGEFVVGPDGRIRVVDFGWASRLLVQGGDIRHDFLLGGIAQATGGKHPTVLDAEALFAVKSEAVDMISTDANCRSMGEFLEETHLVICWEDDVYDDVPKQTLCFESVRSHISRMSGLSLLRHERAPRIPEDAWFETMQRFYRPAFISEDDPRGKTPYMMLIVHDEKPAYHRAKTTSGARCVNSHLFTIKQTLRAEGFNVHCTDNAAETRANLLVLGAERLLPRPNALFPLRPPLSASRNHLSNVGRSTYRMTQTDIFFAIAAAQGRPISLLSAVSRAPFVRDVLQDRATGWGSCLFLSVLKALERQNRASERDWGELEEQKNQLFATLHDFFSSGSVAYMQNMFKMPHALMQVIVGLHEPHPRSWLKLRIADLEEPYGDACAVEIAEHFSDARVVLVKEHANAERDEGQAAVVKLLRGCGEVVHERRIDLGAIGRDGWNMLRTLTSWSDRDEAEESLNMSVKALLVRYANELCIQMALNGGGAAAVSSGGSGEQAWRNTVDLCRIVFNKNGRDFLRALSLHDKPRNWIDDWNANVKGRIVAFAERAGIPVEEIVLSGGSVMQALGLRLAEDFDVVVTARYSNKLSSDPDVSSHMSYFTPKDADDLVSNPLRHFVLLGVKTMGLEELVRMKMSRGSMKDTVDIAAIESVYAIGTAEHARSVVQGPCW